MSALRKFFTKDRMMISIVFIVVAVFLLYYSSGKATVMDGMDVGTDKAAASAASAESGAAIPSSDSTVPAAVGGSCGTPSGYSAKDVANPSDLLPKDDNSQWASLNPSSQNAPNTPDLLKAGYHIGIDTVGQTLRNANQQLRSDPVITKVDIGPWNQSTIEADTMRVPLEVGSSIQ